MKDKKKIGASILKWMKKHRKLLIFLVILAVVVGYIRIQVKKSQEQLAALMANQIETAVIERRSILNYVSTTGVLNSEDSKDITSTLTGYDVSNVYVEIGDIVQEGDLLLKFDTTDLEEDIADVQKDLENTGVQSQIAMTQAQRNYDSTGITSQEQKDSMSEDITDTLEDLEDAKEEQSNYEEQLIADETYVTSTLNAWNAVKGSYEEMQLEYDNRAAALTAAQTELADAQSKLKVEEISLEDYKRENEDEFDLTTGEILDDASRAANRKVDEVKDAQDVVDQKQTVVERASMALNEIKDDYNNAEEVYRKLKEDYDAAVSAWTETEKSLKEQKDRVDSLQKSYDDILDSRVTQDRNNSDTLSTLSEALILQGITNGTNGRNLRNTLDTYEKNMSRAEVKAPFSGTITAVNVDPGDTYAAGVLVTVQNLDELIIATEVDQYDISGIRLGMRAVVKTDATRDDELEGKVTFISPTPTQKAETSTSTSVTYRVEITLNQKEDRLRLGMTAKANIVLEEKENVLTVPYDSVITNEEGKQVITLVETAEDGSNVQREVEVEVGTEGDYYVEIICGENIEGMQVLIPDAGGNALEDMMALMMGE